jgi:hypothetical protein
MCKCKENLNGCGCGCNTCNKTSKRKKATNESLVNRNALTVQNNNGGYAKKTEEFTTTKATLTKREEILEPEVEVIPNEEESIKTTKEKDYSLLVGIGLIFAGSLLKHLRSH